MYEILPLILNMSMTASILVLTILGLRIFFKKVPKRYICVLWAMVAVRLIWPFGFSSSLSFFNLMDNGGYADGTEGYFQQDIVAGQEMLQISSPITDAIRNHMDRTGISLNFPMLLVFGLWVIGAVGMLIYAGISFLRVKRQTSAAIMVGKGVYECDEVASPFIFGIVRPRIFLPSGLPANVRANAIMHEEAHIKRRDYIWKPLGFLLLTLYWFNPIMWAAYIFLCRDIEAACDEKVIADMDRAAIADYSEALIMCAINRRMINVCPVAFGETNVGGRVKNVLNYKKPSCWITGCAAIVGLIFAVGFLTNSTSAKSADTKLIMAMEQAAVANYHNLWPNSFVGAEFEVLGVREAGKEVTVYAIIELKEYKHLEGLYNSGGLGGPVAFTFKKDNSSPTTYTLVDYWEPGVGTDYVPSIRKKFPVSLWSKAIINPPEIVEALLERLDNRAKKYFE